ncbi:hypothetical protein PO909_011274 [Leuciscus waleckii]
MPSGGTGPSVYGSTLLCRLVDGDDSYGFGQPAGAPHSLLLPIMADSSKLWPQANGGNSSAPSGTGGTEEREHHGGVDRVRSQGGVPIGFLDKALGPIDGGGGRRGGDLSKAASMVAQDDSVGLEVQANHERLTE